MKVGEVNESGDGEQTIELDLDMVRLILGSWVVDDLTCNRDRFST